MNPFNHEPRIQLLDQNGEFLYLISQVQACRLLKSGNGELCIRIPPAVQLLVPTEGHEEYLKKLPSSYGKAQSYLHALRTKLYGDYRVDHPDGHEMFRCNNQKILWYLNRDLLDIVTTDPPVFRFKFVPGGYGCHGDDYYLIPKANRCVACGTEYGLNRHHVVPYCFRKHAPVHVKENSHHDILLLCLACHEAYEAEATKLKVQIGIECGITLNAAPAIYDSRIARARKAASAILRHGHQIPPDRLNFLYQQVKDWFEKDDITEDDLQEASGMCEHLMPENGLDYGQVVMSKVDIQEFVERWRQHFVDTMQPKFLPEAWSVTRKAC